MNQKGIGNRLLSLVLMMAMVIGQISGMSFTVHAEESDPLDKSENPAIVENTATVIRGGNTIDLMNNITLNDATGDVSFAIDSEENNGCSLDGSVLTSGDTTGSVTVNVTVADDDKFSALAETPITVTITDKNTQNITTENITVAYGDTDKSVSATTDGDGVISYAVKEGSEDYIEIDASTGELTIKAVPTDGEAYVIVTATETNTYEQATREVIITITDTDTVTDTNTDSEPVKSDNQPSEENEQLLGKKGLKLTRNANGTTIVTNEEEFSSAIEEIGGLVQLGADISLETAEIYAFAKELTLDLNGHTLTLVSERGYFETEVPITIKDEIGGGAINVIGYSSPDRNYAFLIYGNGSLTLQSGTLHFTSSNTNGIDVYRGSFTMSGGTINSNGASIWRDGDDVTIGGGTINGEFYGTDGNIAITGGKFSFDPNSLLSEEYTATPDGDYWVVGPKIEYGLWVNGVKVTNANMSDVLANDSINKGKVSFTPATDSPHARLTLKGATITSGYYYSQTHNVGIFYNGEKPLDIVLEEGTVNTVNPNGTNPVGIFDSTGDLSFFGNGSISVTGDAHGIACARNITIGDGTIIVSGTENGIHSEIGIVNITGGTVTVSGGNKAIDCNVKNSIAGTGWTDTEGITGRAAIGVNSDTGQDLSSYKKVMFPALVEYPLWVGNKQVTNENTSDILGNQTAYYDAASNTLTLNGATITTAYQPSDSNWKYGIYYNGTTALNIVLADGSENTIVENLSVNYGISSHSTALLTITGTGSFSAKNTVDCGVYTFGSLTIKQSTVDVSSTAEGGYGIYAGPNVTIEDATVTAIANGTYSYGIYTSSVNSTVAISSGSVVAAGSNRAVDSILNNNIEGTGWDNTGGEGDGSPIHANFGKTNYLKVRFPANHEHDGITFAAWTATDRLPVTAGNYYLENDVTLTETWNGLQGNINLCLNGKKISVKGGPNPSNDQGIYIPAGKTLSLYDCEGFGKIQPRDDYKGRCFDVVGTLNMYGGTICGFGDENLVRGAAVELWNAEGVMTFNMYGGTISGNTSMSGPAVYGVLGSLFNMSGGTISENTSIDNTTGAVHMRGSFTMSGGSITQNTKGGVAIDSDGTIKVSGNSSVTGNTGSNVYLGTDKSNNQKLITISGELDNAILGITMEKPGIFTSGLSGKGEAVNFTSDNNRYTVELDSGEAKITQSIYSVNFHLNYGTEDVIFKTKDVNSGEYVTKPETDPVREKYHFKGWYKEPGCTSLFNFSKTAINTNTELYAGWAPMITIHYDLGAGHEDLTTDVANAIEILLKDVSPTVKYTGHVVTIITPNYFPDQPFNSEPGLDPIGGLTPVTESGQTITVHFAQQMLEGKTGQLLGDDHLLLLFVGQNPPGNYNSWEDIFNEQRSEDSDIVGEKTFYALWGTPIEQFDIECDPLICGTAVTYDDETELQSPEPVLTFDNAIVLGSKASWYDKDTDGHYSKLEFEVDGKNKYLLSSQFSSLFPKVFTEKTKVKLNGVEAKISPVSEDEPVMQPLGNILFLSGLIQADHDWEEVVLKEPTITEEGQKGLKCKNDKAEIQEQTISRVTYSAVSGEGNVWVKGSKSTSNFRFVRSFQSDKYPETNCLGIVLVDGKPTDAANYDTDPGSVWVKLKPSYLETLSTGKHTIQATFTETYGTGTASYTTKEVTFAISPKSSGGGSTPAKKKDNVVTCQMAGFPANYAWNEAAKACQPGYIDAGGNFHSYSNAKRSSVPNTSDNGNLTFYTIAMFLMTFVAYITAKKLTEDSIV